MVAIFFYSIYWYMSQKDIHTIIDEVIREVVNPNWQISSIPDGYEHGILDEEDEDNNEIKNNENGKTKTNLGKD